MIQNIIFFDGLCPFCNSGIQFFARYDNRQQFWFAPLQSELGQTTLRKFGVPQTQFETLYLLRENELLEKSDAIIAIFQHLKWFWPFSYFMKLFPKFIRDKIYHCISRNRFRLSGKNSCSMTSSELKGRIITSAKCL